MPTPHTATSGHTLTDLIRKEIRPILAREYAESTLMHLYPAGDYWVAFEKSAYLLHRLSPDALIFPLAIAGITFPVIMASLDNGLFQTLTKELSHRDMNDGRCTFRTNLENNTGAYLSWHTREAAPIADALPAHPWPDRF